MPPKLLPNLKHCFNVDRGSLSFPSLLEIPLLPPVTADPSKTTPMLKCSFPSWLGNSGSNALLETYGNAVSLQNVPFGGDDGIAGVQNRTSLSVPQPRWSQGGGGVSDLSLLITSVTFH